MPIGLTAFQARASKAQHWTPSILQSSSETGLLGLQQKHKPSLFRNRGNSINISCSFEFLLKRCRLDLLQECFELLFIGVNSLVIATVDSGVR